MSRTVRIEDFRKDCAKEMTEKEFIKIHDRYKDEIDLKKAYLLCGGKKSKN